jgi:hypothetical protein
MRDKERADLVMIGVEQKRGWRGWNEMEPDYNEERGWPWYVHSGVIACGLSMSPGIGAAADGGMQWRLGVGID